MKPLFFPALAVSAVALTGCTVHNHYYGAAGAPGVITPHAATPGQAVLADQLKGIHTAIEVAAANLAFANAIGYKSRRTIFVEGQAQPNITTDWRQGGPLITDRPLDIYIEGDGFFKVETHDMTGNGTAYTRRGNFFVNRDGHLVLGNADGPRLADGITVTGDVVHVTISTGGEVMLVRPDNSVSCAGHILLHTFVTPDGLVPLVNGLYLETEASGSASQGEPGQGRCGTLVQGQLENSNVNVISTWVELKKLSRWADAIAEEIGLTESQRQTLSAPADAITPDEFDILLSHDH